MATGAICGEGRGWYRRHIRPCWGKCDGQRRRIVEWWGGAWYPAVFTCCACGDSWSDGQLAERPFRRGWRQEAVAEARANWVAALTPRQYRANIRADLEAAIGPIEPVRPVETVPGL